MDPFPGNGLPYLSTLGWTVRTWPWAPSEEQEGIRISSCQHEGLGALALLVVAVASEG